MRTEIIDIENLSTTKIPSHDQFGNPHWCVISSDKRILWSSHQHFVGHAKAPRDNALAAHAASSAFRLAGYEPGVHHITAVSEIDKLFAAIDYRGW